MEICDDIENQITDSRKGTEHAGAQGRAHNWRNHNPPYVSSPTPSLGDNLDESKNTFLQDKGISDGNNEKHRHSVDRGVTT